VVGGAVKEDAAFRWVHGAGCFEGRTLAVEGP